jgi:HD superfamily phosphodiesterase
MLLVNFNIMQGVISETTLVNHFKPIILECRSGDWEHAVRVVEWIKVLGKDRNDLLILIIAGYLHDIGWYKLVGRRVKLSRAELLKLQPKADKQTETLLTEVLKDINLEGENIKKIKRLIQATETYIAAEEDEKILVDSDNLSKTDPNHIKEKYKKTDWLEIIDLFEQKLPQRIKTKQGKKLFSVKLAELRTNIEMELGL